MEEAWRELLTEVHRLLEEKLAQQPPLWSA